MADATPPYLYLTTTGRRSGQPREIEIWFTRRNGRYYVIAETRERAQWVQNLTADPRVRWRVDEAVFSGRARIVDAAADPALSAAVQRLSAQKYGWGDGLVVELTPDRAGEPDRKEGAVATIDEWKALGAGMLPGLVGVELIEIAHGRVASRLRVRPEVLSPNGYLHAATVVALADTSCGYGTVASLPDGARGFTTIELKANFLGTVLDGAIACEATLAHGGRTTQVWDARVTEEATGRLLALFRCTQMVLYPR